MRITVSVHGHLKSISSVGQEEVNYSFPDGNGMRIRDLLTTINLIEEEIRAVFLNGRLARLDEPLRHRIKLDFYPKDRHSKERHQSESSIAAAEI